MIRKQSKRMTGSKLLRKLPRKLPGKILHSTDSWERYGVVWAENEFNGFDLLVLATNILCPPAQPDSGGAA